MAGGPKATGQRSGRDDFRRCPGERARDFHGPERLSSDEEPVRALRATPWRASTTPRSRHPFVRCGFPRRTRPLRFRSATTERNWATRRRSSIRATNPKHGHAANAVSSHATEAFHPIAFANAVKRRLRAARPPPLRAWVAYRGMPSAPADGIRLRLRAAAQRRTRLPSGHPRCRQTAMAAPWSRCAAKTGGLGSPSDRPRERTRPSCKPGCLR